MFTLKVFKEISLHQISLCYSNGLPTAPADYYPDSDDTYDILINNLNNTSKKSSCHCIFCIGRIEKKREKKKKREKRKKEKKQRKER